MTNPYPVPSFFPGFATKEVAFFHKDSKSLIEADLLFNMPPKEQVGSLLSIINWVLTAGTVLDVRQDNFLSCHQGLQSLVVCAQAARMGRWR